MATPNSEEMGFETTHQLDYPVLCQIANLIDIPDNKASTKFGLLKVVLIELSSVKPLSNASKLVIFWYIVMSFNQTFYFFESFCSLQFL